MTLSVYTLKYKEIQGKNSDFCIKFLLPVFFFLGCLFVHRKKLIQIACAYHCCVKIVCAENIKTAWRKKIYNKQHVYFIINYANLIITYTHPYIHKIIYFSS